MVRLLPQQQQQKTFLLLDCFQSDTLEPLTTNIYNRKPQQLLGRAPIQENLEQQPNEPQPTPSIYLFEITFRFIHFIPGRIVHSGSGSRR